MSVPQKFYRVLYWDQDALRPFETHQFDQQCDNWFATEAEAEQFITSYFDDAQSGDSYRYDVSLLVVPVFAVRFRGQSS